MRSPTNVHRANRFFQRGHYHFLEGKWPEAENNLREAIELYPTHAQARLFLGAVLAQQRLYLDAIEILEVGRQMESISDLLHFRFARLLGDISLKRSDFPAAAYYLKLATSLCDGEIDPTMGQLLAVTCCKSQDFETGFDFFLQVHDMLKEQRA